MHTGSFQVISGQYLLHISNSDASIIINMIVARVDYVISSIAWNIFHTRFSIHRAYFACSMLALIYLSALFDQLVL